jgi:trans-2,3-dihydro-3-hydroxyanthranilate isomerase
MQKLEFYIADVFAERKYAGNQLAVFRNCSNLNSDEMQKIARETNFAETTFILSDEKRNGGFDVRIFTPEAEVPFAGHPTLGTAFIINSFLLGGRAKKIILNLKVGAIPVDLNYSNGSLQDLWMQQINPTFGRTVAASEVAPILNIDETEIDSRYPIHEVSTGLPYFIVPLQDLETVKKCRVDLAKYLEFVERKNPVAPGADGDHVISSALFVFCPESYERENHLNARMFDTYYGVPEDPATGSANGCLLAYLLRHNYFGSNDLDLRVEQGYEISRPSLLRLKGKTVGENEMDIRVGGQAHLVAKGEWYH